MALKKKKLQENQTNTVLTLPRSVMPVSEETDRELDSPFELEVKRAIEQLGYEK